MIQHNPDGWRGLTGVGPYPLFLWAASTTGWAAADLAVRVWRKTN